MDGDHVKWFSWKLFKAVVICYYPEGNISSKRFCNVLDCTKENLFTQRIDDWGKTTKMLNMGYIVKRFHEHEIRSNPDIVGATVEQMMKNAEVYTSHVDKGTA